MPFLQLENVTRRFGGVVALDNVSLDVEQGEMIRPNGAGKTTAFNVITGRWISFGGLLKARS